MEGTADTERSAVLKRVRLVALDVDGVLTDGQVVYVGDEELQSFCVQDGQGIAWLRSHGIEVAWITGRGSRATERRAEELGVRELHMQSGSKAGVLDAVQKRLGISPEETVAMGDDLPDLGLASQSALFAAPANARPEVKARAGIVTQASGGHGAVRELVELVLVAQGLWAGHVATR